MLHLLSQLLLHCKDECLHLVNTGPPWWCPQTFSQILTSFSARQCLGSHFCQFFSTTSTCDDPLPSAYWEFWCSERAMFIHHGIEAHMRCQTSLAPFQSVQCTPTNDGNQLPGRKVVRCPHHFHCMWHAQLSNLATSCSSSSTIWQQWRSIWCCRGRRNSQWSFPPPV